MIYAVISILSVISIGCTTLIGYCLFNWAFSTNNIFFINAAYLVWFAIIFPLAWHNGAAIHKLIKNEKEIQISSVIAGIAWALSILAIAVYVWFKVPYSTGTVITRVIWSYISFALAAGTLLMITIMYDSK